MASTEAYIVIDIGTGNVRVAVAAVTEGKILGIDRENIIYHKDTLYPEAFTLIRSNFGSRLPALTKSAWPRLAMCISLL
jgi:ribulose kinase